MILAVTPIVFAESRRPPRLVSSGAVQRPTQHHSMLRTPTAPAHFRGRSVKARDANLEAHPTRPGRRYASPVIDLGTLAALLQHDHPLAAFCLNL